MTTPEAPLQQVVLADDDPDHGILFELVLKQVDPFKKLLTVKDGVELMELLNKQVPDLLFLDLNMPCKNGYECLDQIRQHPKLEYLPVVVYSNSSHLSDIQKSYFHLADLYMVKPFSSDHLKNALMTILKMEWRDNYPKKKYYFINNRFVPFTA